MQNSSVYILGFGAIGKALAVFLKQQGRQVSVIRGRDRQAVLSSETVTVELPEGKLISQTIRVSGIDHEQNLEGTVVVTSKSFANREVAAQLKEKLKNGPVVVMQNGLGVEKPFLEAGLPSVYRCVLFNTSQLKSDGVVRYRPVKPSAIGLCRGNEEQLHEIVQQLHTPDFQFQVERDIQRVAWKKTLINVVFNSVCPLLDVDNGVFHREPEALALARSLIKSSLLIAERAGVKLSLEEVEEGLLSISRASDGQPISTLQDIRSGRPTEIDSLNFELVRLAQGHPLENEITGIRLLGELVRIKEKINLLS